jgi:hypothetical protein
MMYTTFNAVRAPAGRCWPGNIYLHVFPVLHDFDGYTYILSYGFSFSAVITFPPMHGFFLPPHV